PSRALATRWKSSRTGSAERAVRCVPVSRYVRRRLLQTIPMLWGVATLVFVMLQVVPGDPIAFMLAESQATPELIASLKQQLGLDQPLPIQYLRYLGNVVRGDFGMSVYYNRPVLTLILEQAPATIQLTLASLGV